MRRTNLKNLVWVWATVGLLGTFSVAAAAEPDPIGVVWGKDIAARTLTIDADVYRLTEATTLRNREGGLITLQAVPVAEDQNGWLRHLKEATVQYSAHRSGGHLVLDALRLVEPPE